ncbi:4171_t:CDS:2, partial [Cetraspora pellucida]
NIINKKELSDKIILEANYEAYNNNKLNQNNESKQIIEFEQTNEMELIGSQEFTKLENIFNSLIGVYKTAFAQSALTIASIHYNCHTKCD